MPRYTVEHSYTAVRDGTRLGPWEPGDEVDVTEDDAAWVDRDSPGALKPAGKPKAAERAQKPAADRQHSGGRNRGQA